MKKYQKRIMRLSISLTPFFIRVVFIPIDKEDKGENSIKEVLKKKADEKEQKKELGINWLSWFFFWVYTFRFKHNIK